MNFILFASSRYIFFSRKFHFAQLISWLSLTAIAFATAALFVILSVFNGLESLMQDIYSSFDPDIKISATHGKSFAYSDSVTQRIQKISTVAWVNPVIQDYVYVRYRDADLVVQLKGVQLDFLAHHPLKNFVDKGTTWHADSTATALVGRGVQYALSLSSHDPFFPLQVFYIKKNSRSLEKPYQQKLIQSVSFFSLEKEMDENYIITPLAFAEDLMDYHNKRTAIEIFLQEHADVNATVAELKKMFGEKFTIQTRLEQRQDLFRLLKVEKLITFLSLSLILLIASLNLLFSIVMRVMEKRKDIFIFSAMGLSSTQIKKMIHTTGLLVTWIGMSLGLAMGIAVAWLQQHVGLVGMGMERSVIQDYPIEMKSMDVVWIVLVVSLISLLMTLYPARLAVRLSNEIQSSKA